MIVSKHFKKIIKFASIGFINTGLDFIIYNFVCHFIKSTIFGIPSPYIAQACSATLLIPFSYFLNRKWTFKSNKSKRQTVVPFFVTNIVTAYFIQFIIIFGVRLMLANVLTDEVILNNIAKVFAVTVSMIVNYLSYNFIFSNKNNV